MNRDRRLLCEDVLALNRGERRDLGKLARVALRVAKSAPAPLRRLALDVVHLRYDQEDAPALASMAERAQRALVPIQRRDLRQADQVQEDARLWLRIQRRAGGRCELCDGPEVAFDQLAPHHLEGGHGARTYRQTFQNTMATHGTCHTAYHLKPEAFVAKVKAWCAFYGYPLPRRKEFRQ